jgi:hypothetical protein
VDGDAGRDQRATTGVELQRRIEAGAQVETRGAQRRVLRQRDVLSDARVEDLELDATRDNVRR